MASIEPSVVELTTSAAPFLRHAVWWAIFVPEGTEAPPITVVDEPPLRRYWSGFGRHPGDDGRLVQWRGEPFGAAWVRRLGRNGHGFVDDETPELSIAVEPHVRGRGLGGRLLASLFETVPRCSLSVDDRNPAVRLYRRWGFQDVRVDADHSLVMLRDAR